MPKGVRNVVHGAQSGRNQHRRRKEADCATCLASRTRNPPGSFICGTPSGVKAHRRQGEKPCRPCQEAKNAQNRGLYRAIHGDPKPRAPRGPKVTVKRQYEVECWDGSCERVVAVEGSRAAADVARREHMEDHRAGRIDPPTPIGVVR
jgi:hypothetical protein